MKIRWVRLILGAIAAEFASIVVLIFLVAIFGPNEENAAQKYAEKLGQWVGPVGGAVFSFIGAFWICRSLTRGHLAHGVLFGLLVAAVDVSLLVAMRAPFEWLFVISDAGKVTTGVLAGLCAARRRSDRTVPDRSAA